jgi:hypothetical protein
MDLVTLLIRPVVRLLWEQITAAILVKKMGQLAPAAAAQAVVAFGVVMVMVTLSVVQLCKAMFAMVRHRIVQRAVVVVHLHHSHTTLVLLVPVPRIRTAIRIGVWVGVIMTP